MKTRGYGALLAFTFCLISALSVLYWSNIKGQLTVSGGASGSSELPIKCVQTDSPQIALTFDTASGNEDTARILEILRSNDVTATFFVTGGWVDAYPEDIKAIQAAGHDLGNHSATHSDMNGLDAKKQTEELLTVHQKVKALTGADMTLFRPPFGDYNDLVIQTARENGYFTILWDIDSMDWKDYGTDSIIDAVYNHRRLGNGSIILCHNGAKYTAEALDPLIKLLKEKGFEFVPVSRLIYRENFHIDQDCRQIPD